VQFPSTHLRRAEDVGALIRWRRETIGLSQQQFADRLGVSRKWVNEFEQGHGNAKLGLVLRALNELGIDLQARAPFETAIPTSTDEIDIDAIADMNLPTLRGRS
jgi:transcriptional regulator with XRE-family HTH domain